MHVQDLLVMAGTRGAEGAAGKGDPLGGPYREGGEGWGRAKTRPRG